MRNPVFYFWGYLKQKWTPKGAHRRERLPLYLSEYVWQFNHGQLKPEQQFDRFLKLLYGLESQKPKIN